MAGVIWAFVLFGIVCAASISCYSLAWWIAIGLVQGVFPELPLAFAPEQYIGLGFLTLLFRVMSHR